MVPPAKKLEDLIHLAELCVDLLQQNEEHYAEVMFQSFCSPLVLSRYSSTVTSLPLLLIMISYDHTRLC